MGARGFLSSAQGVLHEGLSFSKTQRATLAKAFRSDHCQLVNINPAKRVAVRMLEAKGPPMLWKCC